MKRNGAQVIDSSKKQKTDDTSNLVAALKSFGERTRAQNEKSWNRTINFENTSPIYCRTDLSIPNHNVYIFKERTIAVVTDFVVPTFLPAVSLYAVHEDSLLPPMERPDIHMYTRLIYDVSEEYALCYEIRYAASVLKLVSKSKAATIAMDGVQQLTVLSESYAFVVTHSSIKFVLLNLMKGSMTIILEKDIQIGKHKSIVLRDGRILMVSNHGIKIIHIDKPIIKVSITNCVEPRAYLPTVEMINDEEFACISHSKKGGYYAIEIWNTHTRCCNSFISAETLQRNSISDLLCISKSELAVVCPVSNGVMLIIVNMESKKPVQQIYKTVENVSNSCSLKRVCDDTFMMSSVEGITLFGIRQDAISSPTIVFQKRLFGSTSFQDLTVNNI
jgi:hypothetical protein